LELVQELVQEVVEHLEPALELVRVEAIDLVVLVLVLV